MNSLTLIKNVVRTLLRTLVPTMVPLLAVATLVGCASAPSQMNDVRLSNQVAPFSTLQLGEPLSLSWQPWILSRFNRRTDYRVVDQDGMRVLRAHSDKAASGLLQDVVIDPITSPNLLWRWNVERLLPGANLTRRGSDDSPVRVIVSFDGDMGKLDVEDRAAAGMVKMFSGRDMPYATLMYVWARRRWGRSWIRCVKD